MIHTLLLFNPEFENLNIGLAPDRWNFAYLGLIRRVNYSRKTFFSLTTYRLATIHPWQTTDKRGRTDRQRTTRSKSLTVGRLNMTFI